MPTIQSFCNLYTTSSINEAYTNCWKASNQNYFTERYDRSHDISISYHWHHMMNINSVMISIHVRYINFLCHYFIHNSCIPASVSFPFGYYSLSRSYFKWCVNCRKTTYSLHVQYTCIIGFI